MTLFWIAQARSLRFGVAAVGPSGRASLSLDVCLDDVEWSAAARSGEIAGTAQMVSMGGDFEALSRPAGRHPLEAVHQLGELHGGRMFDQRVDVAVVAVAGDQMGAEVGTPSRTLRSDRCDVRR